MYVYMDIQYVLISISDSICKDRTLYLLNLICLKPLICLRRGNLIQPLPGTSVLLRFQVKFTLPFLTLQGASFQLCGTSLLASVHQNHELLKTSSLHRAAGSQGLFQDFERLPLDLLTWPSSHQPLFLYCPNTFLVSRALFLRSAEF